jgi:hypothetical protein
MVILWLLVMGLFVAVLAAPSARWLGWEYGYIGRAGDMLLVIGGALAGGLVLVAIFSAVGQTSLGDVGALVSGFIGALIAVGILVIISARSVAGEPNETRDIPPAPPIDDSSERQPLVPTEDDRHPVQ